MLLGVLLVLATAETGRRLHGEMLGLAAGFVAALAPFQIYYSQEARMYMLLALLAAVSALRTWWLIATEWSAVHQPPLDAPPEAARRRGHRMSLLNLPAFLLASHGQRDSTHTTLSRS